MELSHTQIRKFTKKHHWWWRLRSTQWAFDKEDYITRNTKSPRKDWKYGVERAAWRYELMRRHERDVNLKPFLSLTEEEQGEVVDIFHGEEREVVRDYISPESGPSWEPKSWFRIDEKEWYLHAPDDVLSAEFIKLVREERTNRKIREPNKALWNEGKSPSWRWPELLDLRDTEKLNESDRKLYRQAALRGQKLAAWWNRRQSDGI